MVAINPIELADDHVRLMPLSRQHVPDLLAVCDAQVWQWMSVPRPANSEAMSA